MATSDEIAAELEAMQEELKSTEHELEPMHQQQLLIEKEEREAYEAYKLATAKARAAKLDLEKLSFDKQRKANELKAELQRKQRELEKAKHDEALEAERIARDAELEVLNAKWDRLTAAAQWREWAKDHQIKAGHFITENRKVILADPMGLGKTLSSIITLDIAEKATRMTNEKFPFLGETKEVYNYSTGESELKIVNAVKRPVGKRILYFCPASLIRNVEKEFRIWSQHRNVTFIGGMTKAEREFVFNFVLKGRADFVVICNYEAWRKDNSLIQSLIDLDPDTVILDEAHMLKEMKTSAYRGIKTLLDNAQPEYVIPMTGTPILNRPQELFSLLTLVNPVEFHTLNDFLWKYCEQDDNGFWKFQPGGIDRIATRIRKNFMRRTRSQAGIELPPQTIINHDLVLDTDNYPNQARVRDEMRKYATIMCDESKGKAIAAAAMIAVFTRLRQVETWPAGIKVETKDIVNGKWVVVDTTYVPVEESQKLDYVISPGPNEEGYYEGLIPEVIEDERIIVFSQFKAPLHELKLRIEKAGYRAAILDGDTPPAQREEIGNDFDARYTSVREESKYDVVLCNYKVGGVGLNLTAATQMVILDEEWNPGKRDQAYDRNYRIGQENPVTIHVIRNQKTIDDWLANIMETKESIVDGFNSTMVSMSDFKDALDNGLI